MSPVSTHFPVSDETRAFANSLSLKWTGGSNEHPQSLNASLSGEIGEPVKSPLI